MYVSASPQLGGAEASLADLLASVRAVQPDWPLHLVVPGPGPLERRAAALGVSTIIVPLGSLIARLSERGTSERPARLHARMAFAAAHALVYIGRLRRVIREVQPAILHTNGLKVHLLASWADSGPPLVWHLHDYLGSRATSARLLRSSRNRCAVVLAPSRSVARDAEAALGIANVVTVPNAVDLQRFSPCGDRLDLDRLAGLDGAPPGAVRIGLLATFARWKGHATFLRAIACLPRSLPIRAYVLGGPLYGTVGSEYSLQELKLLANQLGIQDRVGFTGFIERPDAALRSLDVVVHASTEPEPFGLVIAEAMASVRPVIVSLAGGAAEWVTPGVDCLAHTPGDTEGLASRIAELSRDAALRGRLGRAGRSTAERAFDRERLARDLLPIYQSVVDPRRATEDRAVNKETRM
jgi:glycosyltransferase involved in cell wall biosynthesis